MPDSIDLLAHIGADARLRHATREQLLGWLASQGASDGLMRAAAGNADGLKPELGQRVCLLLSTVSQMVPDDDDRDDDRDGDGDHEPPESPDPGRGGD